MTKYEFKRSDKLMKYQENYFFVVVKFLEFAENVPKPSNCPAPYPERCGNVVCK
jgi:hypothetical protein